LVANDSAATLSYTSSSYNSKNVSTANQLTLNGLAITSISGDNSSLASDYVLNATSKSVAATINPKSIAPVLNNSGVTKAYDNSNAAPAGFTPKLSFSGLVAGDLPATITYLGFDYNSKDVRVANAVTVRGVNFAALTSSNGSMLGDYQLSSNSASVSASITPKEVSVSGIIAQTNTSDQTAITTKMAPSAMALSVKPENLGASESLQAMVLPAPRKGLPVAAAFTPVMPNNKPSLAQQAMQGLTPKTLGQWSDVQVQSLPATQVAALEAAQLKQVLRLLDADSQIRAINPLVLPKMDLQTLSGLSNKQINALTPEQLANMTKAQINFLMPILSPLQVNAMR
jgi:hypothetical protein